MVGKFIFPVLYYYVFIFLIIICKSKAIELSEYSKNETYSPQGVFNILKFIGTGNLDALLHDTNKGQTITTTEKPKPPRICGRRMIQHNALIVKGVETKPGDWPWHAAIYKISKRRQQNYICGGTVLTESRILTAGHCVVELDSVVLPERLFVVLGKYSLFGSDGNTVEKGVYQVILHPKFQSNPLANDIAILKLISEVSFTSYIQPVCLWTMVNFSTKAGIYGKTGSVVGWGFTEDDELGTELKLAKLPVATDLDCLKSNPNFFGTYLTDDTFCVGANDGVNACNGDSGGGFFFGLNVSGHWTWFVRGIVSLSVSRQDLPLCDPNEYTLFTDVNRYLDFIQSYI